MISTIKGINYETADFAKLWAVSTRSMKVAAEAAAAEAISLISDPVCGAKEIIIASELRKALISEHRGINKLFNGIKVLNS